MKSQSRRSFLKKSAAAGITAPLFVRHLLSQPPNNRVRHASFGAGGHGRGGFAEHRQPCERADRLCAPRWTPAGSRGLQKFAGGKVTHYQDWRVMLDKEVQEPRRRQRQHAGPHARGHGHVGDAARAACLCAKAAVS